MDVVVLVLAAVVALDLAALRWGADSRDGYRSAEWGRRRAANPPDRRAAGTTVAATRPLPDRPSCVGVADALGGSC